VLALLRGAPSGRMGVDRTGQHPAAAASPASRTDAGVARPSAGPAISGGGGDGPPRHDLQPWTGPVRLIAALRRPWTEIHPAHRCPHGVVRAVTGRVDPHRDRLVPYLRGPPGLSSPLSARRTAGRTWCDTLAMLHAPCSHRTSGQGHESTPSRTNEREARRADDDAPTSARQGPCPRAIGNRCRYTQQLRGAWSAAVCMDVADSGTVH
jgi:hypothetical protein